MTTLALIAYLTTAGAAKAASHLPVMPWQLERIGTCETGMDFAAGGPRYVTAFGIWTGNADRARRALHYPADWRQWTPQMQVRVALWHERWVARTYHLTSGWSSWGCGRGL